MTIMLGFVAIIVESLHFCGESTGEPVEGEPGLKAIFKKGPPAAA